MSTFACPDPDCVRRVPHVHLFDSYVCARRHISFWYESYGLKLRWYASARPHQSTSCSTSGNISTQQPPTHRSDSAQQRAIAPFHKATFERRRRLVNKTTLFPSELLAPKTQALSANAPPNESVCCLFWSLSCYILPTIIATFGKGSHKRTAPHKLYACLCFASALYSSNATLPFRRISGYSCLRRPRTCGAEPKTLSSHHRIQDKQPAEGISVGSLWRE